MCVDRGVKPRIAFEQYREDDDCACLLVAAIRQRHQVPTVHGESVEEATTSRTSRLEHVCWPVEYVHELM